MDASGVQQLLQGRSIACLDNSPELSEMIAELLDSEGFQGLSIPLSDDTQREIRRLRPYALILDLVATNEMTWTLMEEIQSDPTIRRIPKIIISTDARALERIQHDSVRYGGDRLILKPFDVFALCDHLRTLVTVSIGDR